MPEVKRKIEAIRTLNLIPRLEEIIKDENEECTKKYVSVENDLAVAGMLVQAQLVDAIRRQECTHRDIYKNILKAVKEV